MENLHPIERENLIRTLEKLTDFSKTKELVKPELVFLACYLSEVGSDNLSKAASRLVSFFALVQGDERFLDPKLEFFYEDTFATPYNKFCGALFQNLETLTLLLAELKKNETDKTTTLPTISLKKPANPDDTSSSKAGQDKETYIGMSAVK